MTKTARLLLAALLCSSPLLASAQVFKCADSTGKIQFSDQPCAADQKSSEVRIDKHPEPVRPAAVAAPRMSKEAVEHEKERARRKQQSDASHQRIDAASAEVWKIKDENQDPQKCVGAKRGMKFMEIRGQRGYERSLEYFNLQQRAELYCGN